MEDSYIDAIIKKHSRMPSLLKGRMIFNIFVVALSLMITNREEDKKNKTERKSE